MVCQRIQDGTNGIMVIGDFVQDVMSIGLKVRFILVLYCRVYMTEYRDTTKDIWSPSIQLTPKTGEDWMNFFYQARKESRKIAKN